MLDFRYHALSLVAVFLALAIGIVLGVTIGDSLLSEAERGVRDSLRADVTEARDAADDARQAVRARDGFIERVAPRLVEDRLGGRRVALVAWGELPADVEDGVREAVRDAGGRIDSVSVFDDPLADLEAALGESQFDALTDADAFEPFGKRVAAAVVDGEDLALDLRRLDGNGFRGRYAGADAVVLFHAPREEGGEERRSDGADQVDSLEAGFLEGLADTAGTVVGVEASDTEPSQVGYYRGRDMTSVDSVDSAGGQVALVLALAGAEGAFGFKPSAREPLPDLEELGF